MATSPKPSSAATAKNEYLTQNMNTTKNTVIYHSADFDGICCCEIARKFLPADTTFIGWNYGDPLIPYPDEGFVHVLDLAPDCLIHTPQRAAESLIWIDHHKTSIEKWPNQVLGYRIDGVAACRLAWQWFWKHSIESFPQLPNKLAYTERGVSEPWAVRLIGEYDIWDKRDPDAETFQYSLRIGDPIWSVLLDPSHLNNGILVRKMLVEGQIAQAYSRRVEASICKTRTWVMQWEGLYFLCVNTARFNSLFFAERDIPETGHDALMGFNYTGQTWTVSLYHAKHRTDLDLSEIAKRHGGGGHRGACGFTCGVLPFELL